MSSSLFLSSGNLLADRRYDFGRDLQLRGDLRYVGRRFSDDANQFRIPAYTVVDLSATYPLTPNVGLAVRVYNLFDEAYAEATYNDQQWILGRPRSVDVSIRASF